ncbi:hypothetical protein M5K25_019678 [Dendrobium thyrsiflorum]|uniref:Uncharacterized protein n=1 Tax=Dendrobium thyrsiflorum TaxID=117978 RepID=A0ABD0UFG4_DENTH
MDPPASAARWRKGMRRAPQGAVGVEDAAAEEIVESGAEAIALRVVVEVRFQHVLDVRRICGDDTADTAGAVEDQRVGRRSNKEIRRPLEKAVAVAEELGKVTDDGVGLQPWRVVRVFLRKILVG